MARKPRSRSAKDRTTPLDDAAVLALLRENPGAKSADLGERLGVPQLRVRAILKRLARDGKATWTGQTRGTRWSATGAEGEDGSSFGSLSASEELPPEAGESAPAPAGRRRRSRPSRRKAAAAPAAAAAAAAESGSARPTGEKTALLEANRERLGKETDATIARELGVSVSLVRKFRTARGIKGASRPRPPRPEATEAATEASASASPAAASPKRKRVRPPRRRAAAASVPAAATEAAAPAAPSAPSAAAAKPSRAASRGASSAYAWRVTLETRGGEVERFLVAPDARSATEVALRNVDGGEVVAMARVGPAIV